MDGPHHIRTYSVQSFLLQLEKRGLSLKHLEARILEQFHISKQELRMVLAAFLLAGFALGIGKIFTKSNIESKGGDQRSMEITTVIPKGYVLIPVQFKNYETVDSILGPMGIADLFTQSESGKKILLVANAKILRAPKNPSVIAVLSPQERASEILTGEEQGLYAVIKNDSSSGTAFVKPSLKQKSRISYASED